MNRSLYTLVSAGLLMIVGSSSAMAATPRRADMTCKDFLAIDETTRPNLVYWAQGLNHKGKPKDAVVDVEATARLVPVIVEQCKAAPQASFWQKMEDGWRRLEGDVRRHL